MTDVTQPPADSEPLDSVHVVEFSEDGYGLQHPATCRPDLIGCQYNEWLRTQLAPDREPGRYIMTLANNNPVYTPVVPADSEGSADAEHMREVSKYLSRLADKYPDRWHPDISYLRAGANYVGVLAGRAASPVAESDDG